MQHDDWSLPFSPNDLDRVLRADCEVFLSDFFSKDPQSIWRSQAPCPRCTSGRCAFGRHCDFAQRPSFAFGHERADPLNDLFQEQRLAFERKESAQTTSSPPPTAEKTPAPPLPVIESSDAHIEKPLAEYMRAHKINLRLEVGYAPGDRRMAWRRSLSSVRALVAQFQQRAVRHYFEYHLGRQPQPLQVHGRDVEPPLIPLQTGDVEKRFVCHRCGSPQLYGIVSVMGYNRQLRPPLGTFFCRQCNWRTFLGIYLTESDCKL